MKTQIRLSGGLPLAIKVVILSLILLRVSLPAKAQFELGASIGPAWGIIGSEFKPRTCRIVFYNDYQTKKTTYADTSFSCGGGLHMKLTGSYTFKKTNWLGVQLAAGYSGGKELNAKGGLLLSASWNPSYYVHYNTSYQLRGRMIWLEPAIRFALPGKKWSPWITAGPMVAYHIIDEETEMSCTVTFNTSQPFTRLNTEFRYQRGVSVGAALNAGLTYNTGWGLGVFIECSAAFDKYKPASAEFVRYEVDGESKLDEMAVCNKTFRYTDVYDPAYYDEHGESVSLILTEPDFIGDPAQDRDKPRDVRSYKFSFSNIALTAGLCYRFGD